MSLEWGGPDRKKRAAELDAKIRNWPRHPGNDPYKVALSQTAATQPTSVSFDQYGVPSSAFTVTVTCGDTSKNVSVNADSGIASVQ